MLGGTLIPFARLDERTEKCDHVWYSGKHKRFGNNVQMLIDPTALPT